MEPVIFFTSSPCLEDLLAMTVCTAGCFYSLAPMQPHIIKCREMIFTEPDIIASPALDMDASFHFIAQMSPIHRVHPALFQACLVYSIKARLAPSWNVVGDWFLQGRDFLTHNGYTNAIKMKVQVNQEELFVSLVAAVVRCPPMQVEDLNVSRKEMLDIIESTQRDGHSFQVFLEDSWCHVMPSLKRARVTSLSLVIPEDGPFTTYNGLKRYWKNTYGFRLPETDEDILYCQVTFCLNGAGKLFTYPSVCLRSNPLHTVSRIDPKPVLSAFLQDLHNKHGKACGQPIRFEPKIRHPGLSLYSATQNKSCPNLTNKIRQCDKTPLRSRQSLARLYHNRDVEPSPMQQQISQAKKTHIDKGNHMAQEKKADENGSTLMADTDNFIPYQSSQSSLVSDSCKIISDSQNNLHSHASLSGSEVEKSKRISSNVDSNHNQHEARKERNPKDRDNGHSISNAALHLSRTRTSAIEKQPSQPAGKTTLNATTVPKFVPIFRAKPKSSLDVKIASSQSHSSSHRAPPKAKRDVSQSQPFAARSNPQKSDSSSSSKTFGQNSDKAGLFNAAERYPSQKPTNEFGNFKRVFTSKSTISAEENIISADEPPTLQTPVRNKTNLEVNQRNTPNMTASSTTTSIQARRSYTGSEKLKFGTPSCIVGSQKSDLHNSDAYLPKAIPIFRCHQKSTNIGLKLKQSPFSQGHSNARNLSKVSPFMPDTNAVKSACTKQKSLSKIDTTNGSKRLAKDQESSSTPKKARSKPAIQAVDVEALAKTGQLDKVNSVTLTAWLKEKSVRCTSKDKKGDLMDKVKNFLGIVN